LARTVIYPLFGLGNEAKSVVVSAQERLNVYFEPRPDGDKNAMSAYGTVGLTQFGSVVGQPWRGLHRTQDRLFGVQQNALYEIFSDGTTAFRGTLLTSTGRVGMANNGLQVMITDGYGYIYTLGSGVFAQITDPDYPANTTDVTYQDTYFIVNADNGQFYISASLDGTSWDATEFATAESNPDALQRVYATNGELMLCGTETTEFWGNAGDAQFPYANLRGSTMYWRLAAPWSLVDYDASIIGLWQNKQGGLVVGVIAGYGIKRVSNPDVESQWDSVTVSEASGFAYMISGHPFYQINFPEGSWLYDGLTGMWSTVQGYGLSRHRADHGALTGNGYVVAGYQDGTLYKLDAAALTDAGQPIIRRIRGRHFFEESNLISIRSLILDMETGIGGSVSNPQVMLRVSKDGGRTWTMERWTSLGEVGEYKTRAHFRRLGISRDWLFEISVSDPVRFAVVNAYVDAQ
jgi:hypothetical protein